MLTRIRNMFRPDSGKNEPDADQADLEWEERLSTIRTRSTTIGGSAFLIGLFLVIYFFDGIFIPVQSGHAAVRWKLFLGGTELGHAYGEGLHIIPAWDKLIIYDVRIQEQRIETRAYSSDGLAIQVICSVRFRPDIKALPYLHQNVGPDYVAKVVEPEIVSSVRKVLGNYTPEEIYAKDEQGLLDELAATVQDDLSTDGIILEEFLLKELAMPGRIHDAIEYKLEQEQHMLGHEFLLMRERVERERRIVEAEGIQEFQSISGISILRWRGLEATEALARSENTKFILAGTGADQLPILLNAEAPAPLPTPTAPEPASETP